MATLGATKLTLADWAKRKDPSGKTSSIVELLGQSNEILQDMTWNEGNLETGSRITVRTGLPSVYWRLLNAGVPSSKSTTAQVDEMCGNLEARSEVDVDLAKLNGNTSEFRLSEASAFIEAMNQEMAQTVFYGNSGLAPEEFTGMSLRYSATTAGNGQNIVLGGGGGSDNSSIWLIGWGQDKVSGLFPKGSMAGLIHEDLGVGDAFDGSNNRYRAYMDRWQWKCGLAVKDWRYAVRIPNIDISNLVAKSSAADLIDLMIKALHRIPNLNACTPVFYMNRTCFQMLDIQKRDDVVTGGGLRYENVDGVPTPTFRGIPVRKCDQLLENEAVVS
jgi:hypothetical protein